MVRWLVKLFALLLYGYLRYGKRFVLHLFAGFVWLGSAIWLWIQIA